jgi:hypothetical protein
MFLFWGLNNYIMIKKIFACLMIATLMQSCIIATKVPPGQAKKSAPPGQVKKVTGSQSAAPYAPGQQKKKKN